MKMESLQSAGSLELIYGCMFSGKTEELIRRIILAEESGIPTKIFKPEIDKRYHPNKIISHNGKNLDAISISSASEILNHVSQEAMIAIDEVQFFDKDIITTCQKLVSLNKRVILAGLDKNFLGQPFGYMPQLLTVAKKITKLKAKCAVCGHPAEFTFKKSGLEKIIEIGERDLYEARCGRCYEMTSN